MTANSFLDTAESKAGLPAVEERISASARKLKIVFFALHSTTVLRQYWPGLNDKADCWWITFSPEVYAELKRAGHKKIYFKNRNLLPQKSTNTIIRKIVDRVNHLYCTKFFYKRQVNRIIKELAPDIVINNSCLLLNYGLCRPEIMQVQVFHSVPYKKHFIIPETLKYDLTLFPSEYHKEKMCGKFNADSGKLAVVGWPTISNFINKKFTEADRKEFMRRLGLKPGLKNVLYAPTHSCFYQNGLFPKSFGYVTDAFEKFCREVAEMGVNLIIKLHIVSYKIIRDTRLHRIAEKYGVHLVHKDTTVYLDNLVEYFLWITDVLISDVSGILTDFLVLNRPLVYIEPDGDWFKWEEADIDKKFRAGKVVNSIEGLIEGVRSSLDNPDEYELQREEAARRIFHKLDGRSCERGASAILKRYEEFLKDKAASGAVSK